MSYSAQLAGDQAVDGLAIRASGISASGDTRSATETLRQINLFGPVLSNLQFGVFLSPRADGIGRLRDNVHAAEEAGFDFISVQDHPYVPDFLDTFALIGTLIGQTSRIRFITNVANLPLRPPQMLAKASASLDLLSGGRFELGLGAGRAWPQIAGLGGPVRSPAEALGATAEAIDVLRALWLPDRIADLPGRYPWASGVGDYSDEPPFLWRKLPLTGSDGGGGDGDRASRFRAADWYPATVTGKCSPCWRAPRPVLWLLPC
jgi:alkanesulfonate monooxygenase SsuD/methylene tetrahydromethanopterin reductase-like flavin-dependent oxidoreductase (luciferase family)